MNQPIQSLLDQHFSGSPTRSFDKGEVIIQAGEAPSGVMQLREGIIEQYDITPEGNRVTVNIFKPPAFFPMSWAINKTPNSYFYEALTAIEMKIADADETVGFLRSNPDVMFDLLSRVYRGTDALLRRHVILARGTASSRVMFELLLESYRFGSEHGEDTYQITIKHAILADRCGVARETVSRELHKLEVEKLIEPVADGIIVHVAALETKLSAGL